MIATITKPSVLALATGIWLNKFNAERHKATQKAGPLVFFSVFLFTKPLLLAWHLP